jgi:hypothetical protein
VQELAKFRLEPRPMAALQGVNSEHGPRSDRDRDGQLPVTSQQEGRDKQGQHQTGVVSQPSSPKAIEGGFIESRKGDRPNELGQLPPLGGRLCHVTYLVTAN